LRGTRGEGSVSRRAARLFLEAVGAMEENPSFAAVLCCARSGSTLLRVLLDNHPDIGAPGEAGMPSLMAHLFNVWQTIDDGEAWAPDAVPDDVRREIARAVVAPMRHYCSRRGKRIYVDKSLDSLPALPVVDAFVPDCRYILLFRHVLDTVASGVEASPWGFHSYGYGGYVQPWNFVAGLVGYWCDYVEKALKWEEAHPGQCLRVSYEALVANPQLVMDEVCAFLDVPKFEDVRESFAVRGGEYGPGDHKLRSTSAIHDESIGSGKIVPVEMIPTPLLNAANTALSELGYQEITADWNFKSHPQTPVGESATADANALRDALAEIRDGDQYAALTIICDDTGDSMALGSREGRVADAATEKRDALLVGSSRDLLDVLTNDESEAKFLRAGRLRFRPPAADVGQAVEPSDWIRRVRDDIKQTRAVSPALAYRA
jgi:protein-tyrosine sulfotransferase